MTIIGIDPGMGGGIAWMIDGGKPAAIKMPESAHDISDTLVSIVNGSSSEVVCIIEHVPIGMPGKGAGMAKLNLNFGMLLGALAALHITTHLVRPAKWQKHYSLGTRSGCASDTEWKNKLRAEAQRRFPDIKVTLAIADALLLLDYGRSTLK